jgi:hypothetical protein
MRLRCQPEWFFKYFKNYLLGYQRSMTVQNKLYEEGYDDDEYQPSEEYIERYNQQPFPQSKYYTFIELVESRKSQ